MTSEHDLKRPGKWARVLAAVIVLLGGGALLWIDLVRNDLPPLWGGLPWVSFLLGAVLLWRALSLTTLGAAVAGVVLVLAGFGLFGVWPWFWIHGGGWLAAIGLAFPFCVALLDLFPRRPRSPTQNRERGEK